MAELTEFHRGWMIEVVRQESGFRSICYSPVGERLSACQLHPTSSSAWRAALELVDLCFTCDALSVLMREFFEADQISFDEMYALNQSLDRISLAGFIQTHPSN